MHVGETFSAYRPTTECLQPLQSYCPIYRPAYFNSRITASFVNVYYMKKEAKFFLVQLIKSNEEVEL